MSTMRNQIGIPPLDHQVDSPRPLPPGSTAPKVPHVRSHAGMDPEVAEGARHGDAPYVGGFDKPITERDTNVGLYIGVVLGIIALVIILMVVSAVF